MKAFSVLIVPGTGLIGRELRKSTGLDQVQVLPDRSFHGPENLDPGGLQFSQCTAAYAADGHGIHIDSPQGG